MVHDSKLPPGSILLRSTALIVPRYEGALLFMVVHARCSDRHTSVSLSRSFFAPLYLLFLLFPWKRGICTIPKIILVQIDFLTNRLTDVKLFIDKTEKNTMKDTKLKCYTLGMHYALFMMHGNFIIHCKVNSIIDLISKINCRC